MLRVIGPGAVMAATSIGGGEWLVGPAVAVKYSSSIFLLVTAAIFLQVIFNLEAIRYTLYTGEPIYGGIMRLKPGPKFWALFYTVLGFLQLGWPALAGSAAATLLSAWMGKVPTADNRQVLNWTATILIIVVILILSFGGTIERMLEKFAWTMLFVVFSFLLFVNIAFVPLTHWWTTFSGFSNSVECPGRLIGDSSAHSLRPQVPADWKPHDHKLGARQRIRNGCEGGCDTDCNRRN